MTNLLKLPDGRSTRLLGSNVFFDRAGAVIDIHVHDNQDDLVKLWYLEQERVLLALDWENGYLHGYTKYSKGIRFAISAPFDLLWAATDLLDYIWLSVRHKLELGQFLSLEEAKSKMMPIINQNTNLIYRQVYMESVKRHLNVFESDGKVAIGSGKYAYIVDMEKLSYDNIPWDNIREIPAVLVTGTNGKTTTVRLTRFICKSAGKIVGYCSSDWIMVGDTVVEKGDLSGPSGNQGVMMNPDVELAVLEVARGGLLRRGVVTNFVRAATVTNISEDHLGEDGVDTVEELAEAKALVYKAVISDGYSIINLDDRLMREKSKQLATPKIFITKNIDNPEYVSYLRDASYICYIKDNAFYWRDDKTDQLVATFANTPVTVNGNALHNVENAMNAIALSFSLGQSIEHIGIALQQYENTAANNQGRANVFNYRGGKIIVDFAHNIAGLEMMLHLARLYIKGDGRLGVLFGNTGNRVYLAQGLSDVVVKSKPDIVIIKELIHYLRGTQPGELVRQMQNLLIEKGINPQNIHLVDNEFAALDIVLDFVKPGDVFLFVAHESTAEIIDKLEILKDK